MVFDKSKNSLGIKYLEAIKHAAPRLACMFLVVWGLIILGMSWQYMKKLLNPVCIKSTNTPAAFQPVSIITSDQILLQGWWHSPENGIAVLLLGGLGASRDSMLPEAEMLASEGYGVLTVDYRHCVGETSTLGYTETNELQAMLTFVENIPTVEHIAVLGFSVGGAAALLGAAQFPNIEAVIAEGNYANLKDEITSMMADPLTLQWQIQQGVLLVYFLQTGLLPARVSPIDSIPSIAPRPILFIHGENEIQRTRGRAQFASAVNAKLWVVPGTGHGGYLTAHPWEYQEWVIGFLEASFQE